MLNAKLDEAQAGIKIARKNINHLRYTDDTTFMAESEEELKSLLKKVKEESEKVVLKFNIQKTKIMAFRPITSWQINGETVETVTDFIFSVQSIQFNCSVVSDSLQPHGLQPTRLLCPWDFPGKSTGVGYHCKVCLL